LFLLPSAVVLRSIALGVTFGASLVISPSVSQITLRRGRYSPSCVRVFLGPADSVELISPRARDLLARCTASDYFCLGLCSRVGLKMTQGSLRALNGPPRQWELDAHQTVQLLVELIDLYDLCLRMSVCYVGPHDSTRRTSRASFIWLAVKSSHAFATQFVVCRSGSTCEPAEIVLVGCHHDDVAPW